MSLLAVPIIAVLALVLSIICIILVLIISARYKVRIAVIESQYQANELLITNLQTVHDKFQQDIESLLTQHEQISLENVQVSKQLEHRIKMLQSHSNDQQVVLEQLQIAQGEDKFYSRAIKLAKKGAELEEIVSECELPHAEVEMLLSVYQKHITP